MESTENTANITEDEFYNSHYVTVNEKNEIVETWSDGIDRDRVPVPGVDFPVNRGLTQFRFTPDGKENPDIKNEDGVYLFKYIDGTRIDKTPEEIAAGKAEIDAEAEAEKLAALPEEIRTQRDKLLAESDWSQLPDSPLSGEQKEAWAAYRQALRDVPEQEGFPDDVVWPAKPE